MSNSSSVNVSVEVPMENLVQEITYDGQEILQPPLTMSESLARSAQRIDFTGKNEVDDSNADEETPEEESDGTFKTLPSWPWEKVRNHLRSTLTELSVLGDILQLAHQKKYLVLDPVQADPPEPKTAATLIYKKKCLAAAAAVLLNGAERIRNSLNDAKSKAPLSSAPDFHIELLRLRQNWRLRKVGNTIIGDLSYKTSGSRFPQAGLFEVKKAEDEVEESCSEDKNGSVKSASALRVIVPNELQGISYIQVIIKKNQDVLNIGEIGLLGPAPTPLDSQWQQRLEAAQNVLFCKELFSVLASEAVQLNYLPLPPLVVGNQISATLFPNILLIIGLCHGNTGKGSSVPTGSKTEHNHVLEHSLHQLLREVHRKNSSLQFPHPATAPLGISKRRRLAGPYAYDKSHPTLLPKKEGILEEMIRQAQHVVLRLRVMEVLDCLAKDIKDPLLVSHWTSLNAVVHSSVRLNLVSSGYDMTTRTPFVIHVKERTLKCILKDGKAIHLSYEPSELRNLILSQIVVHQVMALQSLSKCLGWTVLGSNIHLGVGTLEYLGNAAGCLLSSPSGKRIISVRTSAELENIKISVSVGVPSQEESDSEHDMDVDSFNEKETNTQIFCQGTKYRTVELEKMEGKNFLHKMEMLMAVLADE